VAVEILTVSLSDESIEKVAAAVARMLGNQPVAQSNPPAPETQRTQSGGFQQGQADPWVGDAPADTGQWPQGGPQASGNIPHQGQQFGPPPTPTTSQGVTAYPQQGPPPNQQNGYQQQGQTPTCNHGAMKYVPAGFSRSTNKAYNAFWGCPAPRGAQDKCRSVPAS
jgi:hypothetical protein